MDSDEFRKAGKEMVDYMADYISSVRTRRVLPDVAPGFMRMQVPADAPFEGEPFSAIMADVESTIIPGIFHWQSPHCHAYFPSLTSFPSMLGEMLMSAINCNGFTWASSPACTELEIIVMDWLAKMLDLPDFFLHSSAISGGGVVQTTMSDASFVCLIAARTEALRRLKEKYTDEDDSQLNSKLVAYCSDQAHSSIEKACLISLVKIRLVEVDDQYSLRGEALQKAIDEDKSKDLYPFFVCATLGTTGCCAFDNLEEIGLICDSECIWLHIDAAYAGSALLCPEFRKWSKGIEYASSFGFNPTKWMLVNFDCTALWVKDSKSFSQTFSVNPLYLKHAYSGMSIDFMHWQVQLSRRFRALKLWFVIRNYGVKGLQQHIRKGVELAIYIENKIRGDSRFEMPAERHLGLVVFRIKDNNELTEKLLDSVNQTGLLHCVPASLKGKYVIRFVVTSPYTTIEDIDRDWGIICEHASAVFSSEEIVEDKSPTSSRSSPLLSSGQSPGQSPVIESMRETLLGPACSERSSDSSMTPTPTSTKSKDTKNTPRSN